MIEGENVGLDMVGIMRSLGCSFDFVSIVFELRIIGSKFAIGHRSKERVLFCHARKLSKRLG